ncbi:hypothetical protein ILP97_37765 [Amycolatopsis sp. H6(2020)]|nr:hypothetical protein [Amycolatopsis sp. H6(2020)]
MQRFGFDVDEPPLAPPPPFAENERRDGLAEAVAEARRKLAEGVVETGGRVEQDSRVRTAFGDWSACMKRAGYDCAGPWQAHDNPEFADRAAY